MSKKAPNKYFVQIIIAGITVGFFVSAYKFVFAKPKTSEIKHTNAERILTAATEGRYADESDEK
ncbi:hypothetical protein PYR78_17375 [Acinetobacter johnsonii]|nr:hypothetical protein PYR78_17375 [Acinetobacter johnsonii]